MTFKILRSMLFVPGDSEKKLSKAGGIGADAIIIDLEDSVMPDRKDGAREMAAAFLKNAPTGPEWWVRVNAPDTGLTLEDLKMVVPRGPSGIMLPKADGPQDIGAVSRMITDLEQNAGLKTGNIDILPVATETASATQNLSLYKSVPLPRLRGLTWGAEDLATDLGALSNKDETGNLSFIYQMVRAQTLIAARAAGVQPVDGVFTDFRDPAGLKAFADAGFRDGFSGMMAIHPAQVPIINESFTPSLAQIEHAKKVIQAFDADPGAGVVAVDGKMTDIPHLKQAKNILTLVEALSDKE